MSRVKSIADHGQSIWLDYIDRPLLDEGALARMVEEDALAGVTSNPAIFQKAITSSDDYASALDDLAGQSENAKALYEAVAIRDIQDAADVLVLAVLAAVAPPESFERLFYSQFDLLIPN